MLQFQNIVRMACSSFLQKKTEYPIVWGQSASDGRRGSGLVGSRLSAASTLVNHLATCDHQTVQVKERASAEPSCTLAGVKSQRLSDNMPGSSQPPLSIPHPNYAGYDSPVAGPSTLAARLDSEYGPMDNSNQLQLEFNSESRPLTPIPGFIRRSDSMSILHPEDSASAVGGSGSSTSARRPHSHPGSRVGLTPRPSSGQLWTANSQTEFENHIARITVSANLPLSWVDNPEVITFMDKYIPAANSPSRKVLTKRIIPKLVDELQNAAKKETRGKNATLQADGWTGGNHRHLVAFMITADKKVWTRCFIYNNFRC